MAKKSREDIRRAIHGRIRLKVQGTAERPRLAVYRSTKHIYAQVIDDVDGKTLVAASSLDKDLKGNDGGNIDGAKTVGKAIAERAINEGIKQVVYDRGGYVYHGRVKALIDASREAGLNEDSNGSNGSAPKAKAKKAAAEETVNEVETEKADKAKKEKAQKKDKKAENKTEEKAESAEETETKENSEEVNESDDSKEGDNE